MCSLKEFTIDQSGRTRLKRKALLIILTMSLCLTANATLLATEAEGRLVAAVHNPEYLLEHWVELPTAPKSNIKKPMHLVLREAILLALRYNPNIQNAELDRILQRYQLRLANNAFELQYALAGTALIEESRYSGIGSTTAKRYLATPEFNLKNKLGGELALRMDNNVASEGGYNPLANLSYTQPLLRGFGFDVNEAGLRDAIDTDWLNRLSLKQTVMDQITLVISAYRALILSTNNYENQRRQLKDAKMMYQTNKQRIQAGQLEPAGNIQQAYQVESLSLLVEQAANDFKTSTQELLQTIGLDPDMRLAVPDDVELGTLEIPNADDAIEQALKNNTQYLALVMAMRADERAYKVGKNQQLWQLDFTANMQTGNTTNVDSNNNGFRGIYNGQNTTESAGVTLRIPLHDLARRNQLISAKVKLEKDRLNLISAKRALITSIKNTVSTISSQAKQYELSKRQLKLAQQSYELEKKKQHAGISSALDVNNTQNQLIQAQSRVISSKISYLNQMSALQRIVGTTLTVWKITLRVSE
jgi:outer membrane protein TolC